MKRRNLERHLKKHGARLLREGGRHSYWGMDAERSTSVPRHHEIAYPAGAYDLSAAWDSAAGRFSVGLDLPLVSGVVFAVMPDELAQAVSKDLQC